MMQATLLLQIDFLSLQVELVIWVAATVPARATAPIEIIMIESPKLGRFGLTCSTRESISRHWTRQRGRG